MASTTALLLPGLDGTGDLFEPFAKAAPPGIEAVVVDYPRNESSMEVLEKRAREKLADRSIIIAESFSGPIGARLATDKRVRALVLCNSFISSPFPSFLRHVVVAPLFSIPIPVFLIRSALLGSQASPALVEKARRAIRCIPARILSRRVRQVLQADERETLRGLAKPVLYLRGLNDRLLSENCWRVMQNIRPDAQIVRVEGPHMLLQVSPTVCWRAIVRFMEEL